MKREKFTESKQQSLSHAVIRLGRLINQRGLANVRKTYKLPELQQAHLDLFAHIDFEGTTVSEIAKRKGVSKQAVSKNVKEMIEMKILKIEKHPTDSRSKVICLQTSGAYSIHKGMQTLTEIDGDLEQLIGERSYALVLKKLLQIQELFDS